MINNDMMHQGIGIWLTSANVNTSRNKIQRNNCNNYSNKVLEQ